MARRHEQVVTIPVRVDDVAARAYHVLKALPGVESVWWYGPTLVATVGINWRTFGEKVSVWFVPSHQGTQVHIKSENPLPWGSSDFGRNKKHVRHVIDGLTHGMAPGPHEADASWS